MADAKKQVLILKEKKKREDVTDEEVDKTLKDKNNSGYVLIESREKKKSTDPSPSRPGSNDMHAPNECSIM